MPATLRLAADPADAPPEIRQSVRVKTAAAAIECDESHIRALLKSGYLEGHGIGKRGVRVYADSVAAYQLARIKGGTPPAATARPPRPRLGAPHREALATLRGLGILD